MKKNAMLKIAAILMVAVLLTTCAISSTFAKYVTSASGSTSARVAAWGVTVNTSLDGLFASEYANVTNEAHNVASINGADLIVAPGTNGSLNIDSTVAGTPEVSVTVTNAVSFTFDSWTVDGAEYMPVVFTIDGVQYIHGTGTSTNTVKYFSTIAALKTAIDAAASITATYAAKQDLAAATGHDTAISWSWAYEVLDADGDVDATIDEKDTKLAATAASITVSITTTVVQSGAAGDAYVAPAETTETTESDAGEAGEADPDTQD